jgi:hypothetical protein
MYLIYGIALFNIKDRLSILVMEVHNHILRLYKTCNLVRIVKLSVYKEAYKVYRGLHVRTFLTTL